MSVCSFLCEISWTFSRTRTKNTWRTKSSGHKAFMGLAGYYRKYIPEFSVISASLSNLLKGRCRKSTIEWNSSCQKAFEELKEKLSKNPVLYSPNFSKQFIIHCDVSNLGIGVVLTQVSDYDEEHPIMYLSKKFSSAEQKYSTTERECCHHLCRAETEVLS
ncbi:Retrovirus-related Pol polyprotein like [Argiope bruennichi]|uniref:RNA-directed DNA polymerase n=1 Tax=Argiope bruennichi TaxID=94029 RepID=A0A8T0FAX0_ARGBR|nr:Retrovirus-related Pol polyprotein like [Argiope bruennichi]